MNENNTYIEANKEAWAKLSKDHYNRFKQNLLDPEFKLNPIVDLVSHIPKWQNSENHAKESCVLKCCID